MTRGTNAAKPSFVVVCSCINAIDVSVLEFLLPLIFLLFVFVLHVRVLVEVFADFVVAHKVDVEVGLTGHLVDFIANFVINQLCNFKVVSFDGCLEPRFHCFLPFDIPVKRIL